MLPPPPSVVVEASSSRTRPVAKTPPTPTRVETPPRTLSIARPVAKTPTLPTLVETLPSISSRARPVTKTPPLIETSFSRAKASTSSALNEPCMEMVLKSNNQLIILLN